MECHLQLRFASKVSHFIESVKGIMEETIFTKCTFPQRIPYYCTFSKSTLSPLTVFSSPILSLELSVRSYYCAAVFPTTGSKSHYVIPPRIRNLT